MSAHPMLQPVDWSQPPESLENAVSPARLDLYRIVWNSALAVTLRAPALIYERVLAEAGEHSICCMTVAPSPDRVGYWRFRQDVPSSPWPQATVAPSGPRLTLVDARCVRVGGVSLGELIGHMETQAIGTPATTAGLLREAIEPTKGARKPTLRLEWGQSLLPHQSRWMVRLTDFGQQGLAAWRQAELVDDTSARHHTLERVAAGDQSPAEALVKFFGDAPDEVLANILSDVEAICSRWQGLSQADGLRALAKEQAKPPKLSGLPRWIDPELMLDEHHPLRALREEMEAALAVEHPMWPSMATQTKANYRRDWLLSRQRSDRRIPELDDDDARFNVLTHWLIGLPPSR